ncbi:oligosaccharide flippase family protein [Bradyrhizobium sp. dw_78]|uniref:oligosaccharide flippase family protein n=1 Tax=Bradyrhizobium sp. dw_78 TaxID=2719793 RepID=UPI001BD677C8|nr:oligosaccharide flippase family protein [Bradyrhizobium sp. dw_78]
MIKRLIQNTIISTVAFGIAALLGLIVIPVIIRTWGVTEFGLIVLARLLLPTGMMGLLDLGLSEVTTQVVARAREHRNWNLAGRQLSFLTVLSILLALVLSTAIWLAAPYLTIIMRVDADHAEKFTEILHYTAIGNLILIPALVWEGVIKGFERYNLLRFSELSSTVTYVVLTIWASKASASFDIVAYIYLATTVMRALMILAAAITALAGKIRLSAWTEEIQRELLHRCWLFAQGKLIGGIALPIQPFVVGLLFGPKGVGVYDALVRLSRVSKVVVGLLTSALLPVASRLEERGSSTVFQRLGEFGLIMLPMFTVPPLVAAAVLSPNIMQVWIGPQLTPYAFWMGLSFIVPICAQYLAFGNVIFLTRTEIQARLNKLMVCQLLVWAIVAYPTLGLFGERALILGQVIGNVVVLPWQIVAMSRALELDQYRVLRALGAQVLLLLCCGLLLSIFADYIQLDSVVRLALIIGAFSFMSWLVQYFFVLERRHRTIFLEVGRSLGWASKAMG